MLLVTGAIMKRRRCLGLLLSFACYTTAFLTSQVSTSSRSRLSSATADATSRTHPPDLSSVPVWPVPPHIRKDPSSPIKADEYVRMMSLEKIFPGPAGVTLATAWDNDAAFRRAVRVAMRDDLFIPDPKRSDKVNAVLKSLISSCHVSWERSPTCFSHLTSVLESHGIDINGEEFIMTLGGLAGGGPLVSKENGYEVREKRFGSLIDIVTAGRRKVSHSWHLDSGLHQQTVMLGFPAEDRYSGEGVFSHAVKLSHRLRDQVAGGGEVIQLEQYEDAPTIPEEYIIRPWYQRGSEVMVYSDANHIHSAPDSFHREAVWRFM